MWWTPDGRRFPNLLRAPQPLDELGKDYRLPLRLTVEGERHRIVRRGVRFMLHNELGHQGVSGEAYCVELDDGRYYWLVRDLFSGRWMGEPL